MSRSGRRAFGGTSSGLLQNFSPTSLCKASAFLSSAPFAANSSTVIGWPPLFVLPSASLQQGFGRPSGLSAQPIGYELLAFVDCGALLKEGRHAFFEVLVLH